MRIGVISDTHGSVGAWQKAYDLFLRQTDLIIHCGDLLYHGPRNPLPVEYKPNELCAIFNTLEKPIVFVRGNCDAEVDQMVLDYPLESPYAHIFTERWRILVHHGHQNLLPAKTKTFNNLIISGHTHLPVIKKENGVIYLNPGSPALPKDEPKTPTIAVIDEEAIVIWNIETGKEIEKTSSAL
ncbi:MAG: phosphodiesterase [Firmicutes bacterium]|nr:phosphodiesterase [Bacillota bacterium]